MPLSQRMMHIPYGRRSLNIRMSPVARRAFEEARPRLVSGALHPTALLDRSLAEPTGCPPLKELLSKARRILLVTSDPTRQVAYHAWLPHLIAFIKENIREGGVLRVILGGGSHPPPPLPVARRYLGIDEEILCHDSRDASTLATLGRTSRGTEVTVNREAGECDLIIATGAITYHYFAGFTGGPKAVFPGLGGYESIVANHSLSVDTATGELHPDAATGRLSGNPVYEDLLEAAEMLPSLFLANVVLGPDKKVVAFFCGNLARAHAEGAALAARNFTYELREPADVLLLSPGGHPRDISLYQAHKALKLAEGGVKPGGTIFFVAACDEGMGHPGLDDWRQYDLENTKAQLRQGYRAVGHLALSLRQLSAKFDIRVFSKLSWSEMRRWGLTPIHQDRLITALRGMPAIAQHPAYDAHGSTLLLKVKG